MSMFKKFGLTAVAAGIVAGSMVSQDAEAVPAFARQTGMACQSCHSNNFPALNAFGRSFKASSYTMRGAAPLVEGENLSIPADLKMSLITKIRYNLDGSVDGGRGEIQWPDEAAFLVGGRAAENIGFVLENGMMSGPVEANFLGFKVGFNFSEHANLTMFGTDALGVGFGAEGMNTGFKRSQRPIENRKGYSAWQALGLGSGAATGLALAYHTNNIDLAYSHWAPTFGNVNANILGGLAHNIRGVYYLNAAGWDMGIGFAAMSGTVKHGPNDAPDANYGEVKVAGQGIDFQALGELGGMPAEFYLSYATVPSDTAGTAYGHTLEDESAYGTAFKLGVANRTYAYLAYANNTQGNTTTDAAGATIDATGTTSEAQTTIGVQYMLAQNSKLELFNVNSDSSDKAADYTMLMLFSGF